MVALHANRAYYPAFFAVVTNTLLCSPFVGELGLVFHLYCLARFGGTPVLVFVFQAVVLLTRAVTFLFGGSWHSGLNIQVTEQFLVRV